MPGFDLIKNVVLSWQVIVTTIAFISYWSIVSAIVQPRRKRRIVVRKVKVLRRPPQKKELDKSVDTDALGLE
jgi:hypothetical protein